MKKLIDAIKNASKIGCLTGAGVSTLCGIPDFRGPQGLYKQKNAERIFDIDWFERDPTIYYNGCRELIYGLDAYEPGPVHKALKKLEDMGQLKGIATQNIDMLHQKAGSTNVYEVHGSPILHRCWKCGAEKSYRDILAMLPESKDTEITLSNIPRCPCGGVFKPDVTFFGESLPELAFQRAQELAIESDLFLVLGTSLTVFPAAGIPQLALRHGAKLIIVNAQPTPLDEYAAARYDDLKAFADTILA